MNLLSPRRDIAGVHAIDAAPASAGASAATGTRPRTWTTPEGQVPGAYRWTVGGIRVTAIADGYGPTPLKAVSGADPETADALAREAFVPTGDLQCVINTYVVETPSRRVMVDTGFGAGGKGHSGKIWQNLAAAGVDAKAVDALVVTHGHPDHISGMLTADGDAAFPNAELFIHANEQAYWGEDANVARAPDFQASWFALFQKATAAYRGRTTLMDRNGHEIVPGLRMRELFGHTPGHIGLHLADGGEQHLIWTDIIHFPHLQFPRPDWGVVFDQDPALAASVRKAMLDEVAADRTTVSGMHLVFPATGHVRRAGPAYAFEPVRWHYDV